ncbi:MAG TPA: hypothetical protein DCK87_09440 [Desulfotomaculum sp.]|nr:hypothetical protein [Desulfotomaculum sp.]
MKVKIFTVLLLLIMLVLVFPLIANADRCIIIPRDDIVLSEPGQKAFIAHNGQEELLILSTDVKASKNVSVLEFMPLPSRPEVSLAQEDCFTNLKELVKRYNLHYPPVYRIMAEGTKSGGAAYAPVELIFRQKLGVHDVTAVKINDMTEFVRWTKNYFKKSKIPYRELSQKEKDIITDYFNRGFKYFVFDLIQVKEEVRTVPPLIYRFKCGYFYYPLIVTNHIGGVGEIELVCYADENILKKLSSYLKISRPPENVPEVAPQIWPPPPLWLASTRAGVEAVETKDVSPLISEITGGYAYLQAFKYEGPLEFKNDLWLKVLPEEIKVLINNSLVIFDVPPVLFKGVCLVPARGFSESLGAKVYWNGIKKETVIKKGELNLVFPLYRDYVFINGKKVYPDVPVQQTGGRVMVPLRFISEALGLKVEWDKQNNLVRAVAPI